MSGGLGNQIFLLEMARYVSLSGDRKIILDISNIDSLQFGGKSTLEDFLLSPDFYIVKYGKLLKIMNSYLKKYLRYINRINKRLILVLDEVGMKLNKNEIEKMIFDRKPKIVILFGFYQNFKFWNTQQVYSLKNPSKVYLDLVELAIENDPIILHYRTGIIGTVWEYQWGILSPEYFKTALSALEKSASTITKPIWIFSDNIFEVKKLIEHSDLIKKYKIIFVDDSGMSPAELLILFSNSNYLICSNSTFSLAAAKIGNVGNVVAPADLSKYAPVNIFMPNNWIKIKSVWLNSTYTQ